MSQTNNNLPVVLGCEGIFNEDLHLINGHRVGLITNHSGVDSLVRATADKLYSNKNCELIALFGPEHGIRGSAQDGETVESFNDPYKGVPAYSLYGKTRQPNKEMLSGIDRMLLQKFAFEMIEIDQLTILDQKWAPAFWDLLSEA